MLKTGATFAVILFTSCIGNKQPEQNITVTEKEQHSVNRQLDENMDVVKKEQGTVTKVEINLSAFGVESDTYPTIDGYIDFIKDSTYFSRSYYNPAYKSSSYTLSPAEIKQVLTLLEKTDLDKLSKTKNTEDANKSDQPTSTLIIYTTKSTFTISDYGLTNEKPLSDLYSILYKFEY